MIQNSILEMGAKLLNMDAIYAVSAAPIAIEGQLVTVGYIS